MNNDEKSRLSNGVCVDVEKISEMRRPESTRKSQKSKQTKTLFPTACENHADDKVKNKLINKYRTQPDLKENKRGTV